MDLKKPLVPVIKVQTPPPTPFIISLPCKA
jgi:hypothetical protein